MEGIKPLIDEDADVNKQVIYDVQSGILKQMVDRMLASRTDSSEESSYTFDDGCIDGTVYLGQDFGPDHLIDIAFFGIGVCQCQGFMPLFRIPGNLDMVQAGISGSMVQEGLQVLPAVQGLLLLP